MIMLSKRHRLRRKKEEAVAVVAVAVAVEEAVAGGGTACNSSTWSALSERPAGLHNEVLGSLGFRIKFCLKYNSKNTMKQ